MRTARTAILAALLLAGHTLQSQRATTVNDNSTTPAAPVGTVNVTPQNDGGAPTVNVSHYVTLPTLYVKCGNGDDLGIDLGPVLSTLAGTPGGIVDARGCTRASAWLNSITVATNNVTILLPCIQLTVTGSFNIAAGVTDTKILGCTHYGSTSYGAYTGGTLFNYSGTGSLMTIGDPTYLTDTEGPEIGDLSIVLTGAGSTARGISFYRTQDISVHGLSINGSSSLSQIGLYLDGSGNYTGGSFEDIKIQGVGQALWMSGGFYDSVVQSYANASTFTRMHIVCPTSSGTPISGTYGVNLLNGDGNTFVGGDIESCDTMIALGAGATDNTFVGVRNENSNTQITAASGSSYNLWVSGGTMFTGKLTDNGTYNTFFDAFHRALNTLNGDLWRSQADATVTDHIDMGIGLGNVRGRQEEYETDVPGTAGSYQYMWLWGPGDGTAGAQLWSLKDVLNNVQRFGVSTATTAGGANQSFLNGSGTGSVCFQCSAGSGTGGVNIASGGSSPTAIWNVDSSGNVYQMGRQDYYNGTTLNWRFNCAGTGACVLQSMTPTANAYHFRMFNGAGTEIDSEGTSTVAFNNASGSGTGGMTLYEGGSNASTILFRVAGTVASPGYYFPGLASPSGYSCVEVDVSGYLFNTGAACLSGNTEANITGLRYGNGTGADTAATTAQVQTAIGSGVYDASGAASTAQSNAESYSANASNLASGTVPATRLPGATTSTQGAVILPSGASGNTLGSAAMQPTSAFDASGAAATAQSNAEAASDPAGTAAADLTTAESYSANASNLASGTVPAARLPAATTSAQGAVILPSGASGNTLGSAAMQPTSAFDASGAASTAQSNAETYAQSVTTTGTAAGITPAATIHIDNTAGSNYVCINCDNNTGTSGFYVENGTGSTPTVEFSVTGSGNTTANGFVSSKGWEGNYSATFTAGAAAGTSPTIACLSGHTCTNIQGTVSIATGTSTTTGTLVTVNYNHTANNKLDCTTDLFLPGTGKISNYEAVTTTSGIPITIDGTALTASTTYTLVYTCGSY